MLGTIRQSPLALLAAFFLLTGEALAQEEAAPADPQQQEAATAWTNAQTAMVAGPSSIKLKDEATLALPEGYGYVPQKEAAELMKLMGNETGPTFLGLVFPLGEDQQFFFALDYEDSGYVSDEDAREWDADELLESLKEGTEAANEMRQQVGVDPIMVTRWIEKPAYDTATHRLVWAAEVKLKGRPDPDPGVNYNTYVLGREGYVSLNLITAVSTVEADKTSAHQLLGAINFNEGRRYTDFDSSTDKVAAYGLAALVAGAAAKKLGLLAALAALLAKFGKVILVAALGGGAVFTKWFRGRKERLEPPAPPSSPA